MYELLIFDLDGTLADTVGGIAHAALTVLDELGLPVPDEEQIKASIGGGARNLMRNLLGTAHIDSLEAAVSAFSNYYDAHAELHTQLYPGVISTLARLNGKTKLAIATAKTRPGTQRILNNTGIGDYFDAVVTMSEMKVPKPDPGCIAAILEQFGVHTANAIYVGDTMTDVYTAQNAGVDTVVVSYGYGISEVKIQSPKTRLIDEFAELLDLVTTS